MDDPSSPAARPPAIAAPHRSDNALPVFKQIPPPRPAAEASERLERLREVELDVRIELGRTRLRVADVLDLCEGSVIEMDRLAGEAVEVFVGDQLMARGEVMVRGERLCVRISEILAGGKAEHDRR
jgi:flagellar motor switch protein FliN/FliY